MIDTKDPPRLSFTNMLTGDEVVVQFNPPDFDEQVSPQFARLAPQGLSHEVHHFDHTGPYELRFQLRFQAMTSAELELLRRARRHLLSWAYPRRTATDALGGGPPPILIVWPRMLSVQGFMTGLRLKHERFNSMGDSVLFTADVSFEEQPGTLITFDLVVDDNSQRLGDR